MQNIYLDVVDKIYDESALFHVDFEHRNLIVNGERIIYHGEYEGDLGVKTFEDTVEMVEVLNDLYTEYRHSCPSKETEKNMCTYFEAIPMAQCTQRELMGERRDVCQFRLEMFVLGCIINGSLNDEMFGSDWRWKGKSGVVLKRKWVEAPHPHTI